MKIAIVSDSHGSLDRLDQLLTNIQQAGIKYLLHAGDGINYGIEELFAKYPEIKIYYSLGNCDVNLELIEEIEKLPNCEIQDVVACEIEGVTFGLSHVEGIAENFLKEQNIQVFIHGHTHRAKKEERDGKLILNPGALMEDGGYMVIDLKKMKVERKIFTE